jgi:acyl-CoA hydrolase
LNKNSNKPTITTGLRMNPPVEVFAERFSNQGEFIKVTEARLTYVAIDAAGKPTPVPLA